MSPKLWFLPGRIIPSGEEVCFEIVKLSGTRAEIVMTARADKDHITIFSGEQEVLKYRHSMIEAPEGINPLYRKQGAYIHPLLSPAGKVLTNIQPADHYHHYGIWNPWTKTIVDGQEVDFWNLALGEGTVRFAGLISKTAGEVFSGFTIRQEHVNFKALGPEQVAINESWHVKNFPVEIEGRTCWLIDFTSTMNNPLDSAIELSAYRYGGGIGWRATAAWNKDNSSVLTSEGKTRKDADGTHARWCRVEGWFPSGISSGILFCSHPGNRAHPEPMRVWPEDANDGRGDVFFEFCPIRHSKWTIYPGKDYVMKYRMLVFDGEISPEIAESVWQHYAQPVSIEWIK
ncbi:MAG: PmoA family protein [Candidatus Latescibacteria bacterium]|nr:PmoA family protein [Candidatus Latescibacterota bacterium]